MPITLAPFDPSRDFVARANFRAGGRIWLRKQPFDKSYVNSRVLEQLYNAHQIDYDDGKTVLPAAPPVDGEVELTDRTEPLEFEDKHPGDLTPDEQHDEVVEEETKTPSVDANQAATGDEGAGAAASEETATPAPEGDPLDHDHDGKKGGSLPDDTGDRETLIKRLVDRHDHAHLFARASGIKGVKKSQTKAEIAAALVDAGRVGDGNS